MYVLRHDQDWVGDGRGVRVEMMAFACVLTGGQDWVGDGRVVRVIFCSGWVGLSGARV